MTPQTPLPFSISGFHCLPSHCMLHWDAEHSYPWTHPEQKIFFIDIFIFWNRQAQWRSLCCRFAGKKACFINSRPFSRIQYTRSDIPGLCFCVWGRMCLCKPAFHCVELNVTITPQKEWTWSTLYSDSGNITLQNTKQRFSFSFCFFFPHYNFAFDMCQTHWQIYERWFSAT